MKKNNLLLLTTLVFFQIALAQVPQKIVVEHFTNTRCSICAGQNPGFYNNLKNQNGVIHLAIHPSSPYPTCVLSQHNVPENDARTNYYGVYGSTPKFLINGELFSSSSTNVSSPSIFTPYQGKTSPFSIRIVQTKYANDSIRSTVTIKTIASHSFTSLQLFVALSEDTLFYDSPNGESMHYDVFRKSLSGATGQSITVAATVGDSVFFSKSSASNASWNFSRINTIAILQTADTKAVLQSETTTFKPFLVTGISQQLSEARNIKVFVAKERKNIQVSHSLNSRNLKFSLFDLYGRTVFLKTLLSESDLIEVEQLSSGLYIFTVSSEKEVLKSGKLILE